MWTLRLPARSSDQRCLISGFCSSGRDFAPRFLQTVPRGSALALRSCFTSIRLHRGLSPLTVTHIFLLWAKDLLSLADLAASDSRARERTCSMKPVIGPRPSSGRPTLGMQDAPTVW